MCLAKALVRKGTVEPLVIADVSELDIEGDTVSLRTLFGEAHRFQPARLTRVDLDRGQIFIAQE